MSGAGDEAESGTFVGDDGILRRNTARVVVADPDGAVLLFLTYGRTHDVPPRWITPGGGVDAGEDFAAAAVRELREETGLVLASAGAPFRTVEFAVDQRWHPYERGTYAWFAIRTERFTPSSEQWMPDEHVDIVEHRWWRPDELDAAPRTADPLFEPDDLPALIRAGLATLA